MLTQVKPVVVHPTEELRKRIEAHSKLHGMTVSEIVRRAIDQYVPKQPPATTATR